MVFIERQQPKRRNTKMKAEIAHTSEGRTKVALHGLTKNIELFMRNMGGVESEGWWVFASTDAKYIPQCLADEGYTTNTDQLI
jgi:hypothetical protein